MMMPLAVPGALSLLDLWTPVGATWLQALYVSDTGVLDASDVACTNNVRVKTWQDQSGNNRHAVQNTSGDRPTFRSASSRANGYPAIDEQTSAGTYGLLMPSVTFQTCYIVAGYKDGTDSLADTWHRFLGGTNDSTSLHLDNGDNGLQIDALFNRELSKNGAAQNAAILPLPLSVLYGVQGSSDTVVFSIGTRRQTAGRTMDGPICAVALGSGAESTTERDKMVGWMAHRFGLEADLVSGHPYKTSPPEV